MMPVDFAAEGLLDGLTVRRAPRASSCCSVSPQDGFSLTELRDAVAEDRLVLLGSTGCSAAATPPRR